METTDKFRLALKDGRPPGDEVLHKQGCLDQKSAREDKDGIVTVDFIITTGAVDRDTDTVNPDGWDFESFNKNPVVLWAHNKRNPPVARSTRIWRDGDAWKSTAEFMPRELSGFAHSIIKYGFGNVYASLTLWYQRLAVGNGIRQIQVVP